MLRLLVATTMMVATASVAIAAPAKRDDQERAGDPQDKMICKRFVETGSLVKGTRVCKTKRDWERERENIRATATQSGGCNSAEAGHC